MFSLRAALFALLCAAFASVAHADPCEAVPTNGPTPEHLQPGASFSGTVIEVIDGDSFCVATAQEASSWVEVRVADFNAPEASEAGGRAARDALVRVAYGRMASCVAGERTYDRIAAVCRIGGSTISELLRADGAVEGGNGAKTSRGWIETPAAVSRRAAAPSSPARSSTGPHAVFRSCAAARAAGAAPMRRGEPGYNPHLDGDNDGIACEPIRPR